MPVFFFFIYARWANWYCVLPAGASSPYAREFLGEKAVLRHQAGCTFINWAMTGIVDIAQWRYIYYWGAFGDVPQWVFALGALTVSVP